MNYRESSGVGQGVESINCKQTQSNCKKNIITRLKVRAQQITFELFYARYLKCS